MTAELASERTQSVDCHDVREWFAADPAACIRDPRAQKILRAYEHAFRWWIKFPGEEEELAVRAVFEKHARIELKRGTAGTERKARAALHKQIREKIKQGVRMQMRNKASAPAEALVSDQATTCWESFRNHLKGFLPAEVVDRFADYLTGFLLVRENETPRSSATWEDKSKTTNKDFRQFKKLLRELNDGRNVSESMLPPSTSPPHRESIKTRLIRIMSEELVAVDYSRKVVAEIYLPRTWDAIGEKIQDGSFLRTERRSRSRTKQTR